MKISLREYLEKLMDERFSAHQALHVEYKGVLDNRLDRLNELRELVTDIQARNVSREYFETQVKGIEGLITQLDKRASAAEQLAATAAAKLVGQTTGITLAQIWLGLIATMIAIIIAVAGIIGAR